MEDWGKWIRRDGDGWPAGVEEDEEVIIKKVDGSLSGPYRAEDVEWSEEVVEYKRNLLR